jgi:hypothetical protein
MKEIVSKIRLILSINLSIVMLLSGLVVSTISVNAATCDINGQVGIDDGADCAKGNKVADNLAGQGGIFQTIVNILLFLVGVGVGVGVGVCAKIITQCRNSC